MTSSPFASLTSGMLVRKGAATPSLENLEPTGRLRPLAANDPSAKGPVPGRPDVRPAPQKPAVAPVHQVPAPEPRRVQAASCSAATQPPGDARPGGRAGVRLTHDQMRALKLASLLLDRPQQDLLASGLDLRLEALACGPLSGCACFKAFAEKLGVELPPLPSAR